MCVCMSVSVCGFTVFARCRTCAFVLSHAHFPTVHQLLFFGLTGLGDLCASTAIQDTHFQWIGGMCKMIS